MIKKYIDIPIYPIGFWFIVGDIDEANKFINSRVGTSEQYLTTNGGGSVVDINIIGGNKMFTLWLKEFNTAKFVHELQHILCVMFDYAGINHNWDNTETFAYTAEFIYNFYEKLQSATENKKESISKKPNKKARHNSKPVHKKKR
jgi:hypothetical protein